ncbi:hypothetical protein QBC40DRAFT_314424 [Triangularia verruculosa]|uniref:Uncharacterized protein n=1 Tax=Triangularia verruculosa TaxID=2587418 RepID=A0AAN6XNB9_9PEZI|nr:hypothetical protein QBC40DRAFT_314424 [Triangularia verruculosa]
MLELQQEPTVEEELELEFRKTVNHARCYNSQNFNKEPDSLTWYAWNNLACFCTKQAQGLVANGNGHLEMSGHSRMKKTLPFATARLHPLGHCGHPELSFTDQASLAEKAPGIKQWEDWNERSGELVVLSIDCKEGGMKRRKKTRADEKRGDVVGVQWPERQ